MAMRIVFNASNSLDAHMIKDLLHMQDIAAFVHGEHLQSGVGMLQAMDLVQVIVDDADYAAARVIIDEWEAS